MVIGPIDVRARVRQDLGLTEIMEFCSIDTRFHTRLSEYLGTSIANTCQTQDSCE